jgi:hypothetical protein
MQILTINTIACDACISGDLLTADKLLTHRFLDLYQVAPQLGPQKILVNTAPNSAPNNKTPLPMVPTGSLGTTPPPPTLLALTTKGTRKTMANKSLLTSSKSLEEHIAGAGTRTDITNLSTARKILSTHELVLLASASSMKHVIQAIFELSLTVNSRAIFTEILRALGIILLLRSCSKVTDPKGFGLSSYAVPLSRV